MTDVLLGLILLVLLYPYVDRALTLTQRLSDYMVNLGANPDKVSVLPMTVDTNTLFNNFDENDPFGSLDDLIKKYVSSDKIKQYLGCIKANIVENVESFRETEHGPEMRLPGLNIEEKEIPWEKYKVNILVSGENKGAPVIFEPNPTYYNLFGRLEYSAKLGAMVTNFTMIKPGAIHRANGGYLILNALDLLVNFMSYDTLKRVLKTRESHIENIGDQFRIIPVATLNPEPVPVDVKVVLIGNRYIYNLLLLLDEDFRKLFKVKADFQIDMSRSLDHTEKYASLVSARCRQENLKHFDPSGVAKIVEYGTRLAEDKE
ncbi:hypothetical protein LCGC14_2546790, partial [marine sediment metagenome]